MTLETRPAPFMGIDATEFSYHWLDSERSSEASIAQWARGAWHCIGETERVTPAEMWRRGWRYLGPVTHRPWSEYIDKTGAR